MGLTSSLLCVISVNHAAIFIIVAQTGIPDNNAIITWNSY